MGYFVRFQDWVGNGISSWITIQPVEYARVIDIQASVVLGNGIFP